MTRAELTAAIGDALEDARMKGEDLPTAALAAIEAAGVVLIMPEAPGGPGEILDESTLRRMMRDPRYWRSREPDFVKRVTNGFRRLVQGPTP